MFETVCADLRKFTGTSPSRPAPRARALLEFGCQAVLVYRLGRWLIDAPARPWRWAAAIPLVPVYCVVATFVRVAYDIRLELSADIGSGLKVFHFAGIRLRRCKVGTGCVIHQEVSLGPATPDGPGPQVGNRVWIGPHARVSGPVRVGDGATIAAGALVTEDVPAGCLVVGSPAKATRMGYDNSALL